MALMRETMGGGMNDAAPDRSGGVMGNDMHGGEYTCKCPNCGQDMKLTLAKVPMSMPKPGMGTDEGMDMHEEGGMPDESSMVGKYS